MRHSRLLMFIDVIFSAVEMNGIERRAVCITMAMLMK